MSVGNSIIAFFVSLLVWAICTIAAMACIHPTDPKKQKRKRYRDIPYFTMPLYKKVFFMGFKVKWMIIITVLSFIGNISALVNWIACIWNVICNSDLTSFIAKISGSLYFIIFSIRFLILYFTQPDFEN